MTAAFERANAAMYTFKTVFKPIFDEELSKTRDEHEREWAESRAWHRVARAYFGFVSEGAAVTVSASVTALVFDGRYATIGQVGTTRAYRCRSGNLELLLPDQSQNPNSRLGDDGNPSYGLATALLGLGPTPTILTRSVEVLSADRFILVSDGVWSVVSDASIAQACTLATAPAISAALASAAHTALDDVTIAVALVSAAGID
jgi:serine/threonine protein phosphatase PrpC